MNKKGWIRLVALISLAWLIGVSGLAIYEKLAWEPTGSDLKGHQVFFYYYPDPTKDKGFIPLLKDFNEMKFIHALIWPVLFLWVVYGFVYFGGRWVYAAFKQKSP
jgi:hypothetical protein